MSDITGGERGERAAMAGADGTVETNEFADPSYGADETAVDAGTDLTEGAYARQVSGTEGGGFGDPGGLGGPGDSSGFGGAGGPGGPGDDGLGGPPMGHAEPNRPKGLIAAVIVLSVLLLAALAAIGVLVVSRKNAPATTSSVTTTTTLPSPSPSPSLSPTASPSPSPSKSTTGTPTGVASPKIASEKLYAARKANSKTQAKAVASQDAIDQIWKKSAGAYKLNGCESDPNDPGNPDKGACTFVQPGGQMTMYAEAQGGKWTITSVVYEPISTG